MNFVLPTQLGKAGDETEGQWGGLEPGLAHNTYSGKSVLEKKKPTIVTQSLCFGTKARKQHILENKVGFL